MFSDLTLSTALASPIDAQSTEIVPRSSDAAAGGSLGSKLDSGKLNDVESGDASSGQPPASKQEAPATGGGSGGKSSGSGSSSEGEDSGTSGSNASGSGSGSGSSGSGAEGGLGVEGGLGTEGGLGVEGGSEPEGGSGVGDEGVSGSSESSGATGGESSGSVSESGSEAGGNSGSTGEGAANGSGTESGSGTGSDPGTQGGSGTEEGSRAGGIGASGSEGGAGVGGAGTSGSEAGSASPGGASAEPFRFFSPTSFWNESPAAAASLDPSSSVVVAALTGEAAQEEEAKKGPAINTTSWSVPVYTVPAGQPTVKVTLAYASSNPTLQAAWEAVPLPADAVPAAGTDKHLVVWQPSSDKLWEFWHLEKNAEGWEAYWGGAIQNVSSASGTYGTEAWPGAKTSWGASACSLSIAGGLITLEDLEKGTINHALAIAVPNTRLKSYASPARRTDGTSSEASSLPEGAHLRLNPKLDLAALKLPHFTLMLAEAAQKYGIFVRDTAANIALYAQDPTPTGANPYTGKTGFYEGKSAGQLLAAFPWSELQLLKMELRP